MFFGAESHTQKATAKVKSGAKSKAATTDASVVPDTRSAIAAGAVGSADDFDDEEDEYVGSLPGKKARGGKRSAAKTKLFECPICLHQLGTRPGLVRHLQIAHGFKVAGTSIVTLPEGRDLFNHAVSSFMESSNNSSLFQVRSSRACVWHCVRFVRVYCARACDCAQGRTCGADCALRRCHRAARGQTILRHRSSMVTSMPILLRWINRSETFNSRVVWRRPRRQHQR